MKDKIKRFLIEKKELLIFIGVVVFVFTAVIGIAQLTINDTPSSEVPSVGDNTEENPSNTEKPNEELPVVFDKFSLPITGEYIIVRNYFDVDSLTKEELETAVIPNQNGFETSTGIAYSNTTDTTFDVIAIYDGVVTSVEHDDEVYGSKVTIDHGNGITSIYSSLTNVTVSEGQTLEQGTVLGCSSNSVKDPEAGVHVMLQVMINDKYVNPNSIFGKQMDEIVDMK